MKRFFQKMVLWSLIKVHTAFINLGWGMRDAAEIGPMDLDERGKRTTRRLHHNKLLEKFYAGQRDEKYVTDYYELLKKADKFHREATDHKKAVAADRWGMDFGKREDRVEFYSEDHINAGKTIDEVLKVEMEERRTKDDEYEILAIYNNKPIDVGLSGIEGVVDQEFNVSDMKNKSKLLEFPIKIVREQPVTNKIEHLAEFLHIKKIGFKYRQLEFFIPLKYRTPEFTDEDGVFQQLITMKEVYVKDTYGALIGFRVDEYNKRIIHEDTHEVWKFSGVEMETVIA